MNKNNMNMVLKCKILEIDDPRNPLESGGVDNVGTMPVPSGEKTPLNGGDGTVPSAGVVIGVVPPAVLKLHDDKT